MSSSRRTSTAHGNACGSPRLLEASDARVPGTDTKTGSPNASHRAHMTGWRQQQRPPLDESDAAIRHSSWPQLIASALDGARWPSGDLSVLTALNLDPPIDLARCGDPARRNMRMPLC